MKKPLLILAAWLCLLLPCFGQNYEFTTYENGLIYSPRTMGQLQKIVDSLNLKFKSCDLNKIYYAKAQARAHYVHLNKGNVRQAEADLKRGISLEEFRKKYPRARSGTLLQVRSGLFVSPC